MPNPSGTWWWWYLKYKILRKSKDINHSNAKWNLNDHTINYAFFAFLFPYVTFNSHYVATTLESLETRERGRKFSNSETLLVIIICHVVGPLVTRSGLTYPEISAKVYHDSFCQLGSSLSLPWVIYFEAFYLHVVSSVSCIPVVCAKLLFFFFKSFAICAFVL